MSSSRTTEEIKALLEAFSVNSYIYQSSVAAAFGLHPTDMLALHYLGQRGEMTVGELGTALQLTSGATTAAIDRLIKLGFVKRETKPGDRRRVYVRLNQTKARTLKAKYQALDRQLEAILGEYPKEHQLVIAKFLKSIAK